MKKIILFLSILMVCAFFSCKKSNHKNEKLAVKTSEIREIWSKEKANAWYSQLPWLVGANFNPSTAINQLEMWQEETFDLKTIDKELGWAEDIGMNTMRVYLHDLLHKNDPEGLFNRMNKFLEIADRHGIKTLFVLFDSCWDPFPKAGEQRAPKPHVHNSGWIQSPGQKVLQDSTQYGRLEKYVKGTIAEFRDDDRVLGWDIWNEPDNMTGPSYEDVEIPNKVELVMPLLENVFAWARSVNPTQPLTSGIWIGDWSDPENMQPMHKMQLEESDIITFHNYNSPADFEKNIRELQRYGKPILCTEYMARPNGSTFQGFLPIAKNYNVGMFNWGFVDGKTQTKYPWDSWTKTYTAEPDMWFHEVFRNDGKPYKKEETDLISTLTSEVNKH
jgi:hypothetical protein